MSLEALRRANPRNKPAFAESVDAVAAEVQARIATSAPEPRRTPRRRFARLSLAGAALAAAVALVTVGLVDGGESATAAVQKAGTVTAASAERSGTVVVRITNDGEFWAGTTVRWSAGDLSVASELPERYTRRPGSELRVVDGTMYGPDVDGGWVVLGSPDSVDPESGTTPDEYLAAVREDVGGVTLGRITGGIKAPSTTELADGSTIYSGRVAAGLVAREPGFKEGQAIRVLPFGYVAHDKAADPAALLDVAVTVGADGVVRAIDVTWPGWRYSVTYSRLGDTPAIAAPENAKPLRRR